MKLALTITSILGAITIMLGAFGAHALKDSLTAEALASFNTAVKYQMYHVIVLLIVNLSSYFSSKIKNVLSILFFLGILFFSGSIYAITFGVEASKIWFITPLGGLVFIAAWLTMGWYFVKKNIKL